MNKYIEFLLNACVLILLCSCNKEVEFLDNDRDTTYFLNSILEVGQLPEIKVGQSISINDSLAFEYACNANGNLQLENDTRNLLTKQNEDADCFLSNNYTIKNNATYGLTINIDGQLLESNLKTPSIFDCTFELEQIKLVDTYIRQFVSDSGLMEINIYRYALKIATKAKGDVQFLDKIGFTLRILEDEHSLVNHINIANKSFLKTKNALIRQVITEDNDFNKFVFEGEINITSNTKPAVLVPSVYFIEENLYKYIISLDKLSSSLSDPQTVPIKPYGNIEGGVGIFGAYSQATDTLVVELPE